MPSMGSGAYGYSRLWNGAHAEIGGGPVGRVVSRKGLQETPLIACLVRCFLDRETLNPQPDLFDREQLESREI